MRPRGIRTVYGVQVRPISSIVQRFFPYIPLFALWLCGQSYPHMRCAFVCWRGPFYLEALWVLLNELEQCLAAECSGGEIWVVLSQVVAYDGQMLIAIGFLRRPDDFFNHIQNHLFVVGSVHRFPPPQIVLPVLTHFSPATV